MWLQKELQQICIKEFALRQKLDLIQDNAYIDYNLKRLILLSIAPEHSNEGKWQYIAPRCNSYWFNIVGYIKRFFIDVYDIVEKTGFLQVESISLGENNSIKVLGERIQSCKSFLEICRSVTYLGQLREPLSRHTANFELFQLLQIKTKYSDPPGNKLIPLGNRVLFIRSWIEKLVLKNQSNYTVSVWTPIPIFPVKKEDSENQDTTSSVKSRKRKDISVVSTTKPEFHFSRIQTKTIRLSELFNSEDSDSQTSSDSIWDSPFKKKASRSWLK